MAWTKYLLYFVTGGAITTAIVSLEESGMPLFSRLAALFPVFTRLSYIFLGQTESPQQIASHAKFVLTSTLVSWVPYMLSIIYISPRIGIYKAILVSVVLFTVIALLYSWLYYR